MFKKDNLISLPELSIFKDYKWKEITIGCSDTQVFELKNNTNTYFLKVGKTGLLSLEYKHLKLLINYLPVPKIVNYFNDSNYEYLVTEKMPGEMSCSDENLEKLNDTINSLITAINHIQSVKLDNNLIQNLKTFTIDDELKKLKQRIDRKEIINLPENDIFKKFKNINEIYNYLLINKPSDELIFSHGDVSMPNVFLENGKFKGFIDIGNAGIRQKWYDITDAYISVRRNFESQEIADEFLKRLEIKDKTYIEYYEMLIALD